MWSWCRRDHKGQLAVRASQMCSPGPVRTERRREPRRVPTRGTAQIARTVLPPPLGLGRRKPSRTQTQIPRRRMTTVLPPSKRSPSGFAAAERTAGRPHRVQTARRREPPLESPVHPRRPLETAMDVVCAWSADERRSPVDNKVGHDQDLSWPIPHSLDHF
jgi:hypothetical protein